MSAGQRMIPYMVDDDRSGSRQVSLFDILSDQTDPGPPDEVPPPARPLPTISPSRAGDFKRCPRLFKFRSIEKRPEEITPPQARGTTAHLALERLFDLDPTERTLDRLLDLFRGEWNTLRNTTEYAHLVGDRKEERSWGIESLEVLANYFTLEDPASVTPMARELKLSEDLGDVVVRGILDRMDERPDGQLVIIDYKTGSAPPERFALPAFFALKIYALLVQKHLDRTPAELRLMYLGNSTAYSIEVDRVSLEGIERQLLALVVAIRAAIKQGDFPPKPSILCNWCSFQEDCPEGQAFRQPAPVLPIEPAASDEPSGESTIAT